MSGSVSDSLIKWADEQGYRVAWGPISVLDEVREELDRRKQGEIDPLLSEREFGFRYLDETDAADARTVIALSVPRPAHLVTFRLPGGRLEAVVPPTYRYYTPVGRRAAEEMSAVLPGGCVQLDSVPNKAVAVKLGLAAYGRNNITYVDGFGSYHQLVVCATSLDLGRSPSFPTGGHRSLPECERCTACRRACPTGAIGNDRFLLHAERCLTLLNEGQDPWPAWLSPSAHNSL
ncbi:MAG: hypothetical protein NUV93_02405, partial [Firmicutes bacterium]|nr:hypothetical protein [Bacillota bacterium]